MATASLDNEGEMRPAGTGKDAKQKGTTWLFRQHLLACTIFLAVAFVALLPGSLHPNGPLLGFPGDNFQHAWFLWHFARAVAHGENPFVTNLIFNPHDVNLAWSTTDPIASVLALPLEWSFGPAVAYNLSLLLQVALGAFFAYLLCLRICGDFVGAVFGGICFGFSPFLMGEALGHLSLVTTFPVPLYFLALDNMLRQTERHAKSGLWLGLALFLTSLAHYNYTVFCVLLTAVILCVDVWREGGSMLARAWKPFAAAGISFAVLFSPFFISMWRDPAARPQSRSLDMIEGHSADLLGWLVPSWHHPLFGAVARHWNPGLFTAGYEGIEYLGPVLFVLLLSGLAVGFRMQRAWTIRLLVAGVVFWALSLGPRIHVWGTITRVPGPGLLFYLSPFGRFISAPARFFVIAALCVAGVASMAVAAVLQKLHSAPMRTAFMAGLSVALALDLLTVPFPLSTSAEAVHSIGFGVPVDGCYLPDTVRGTVVATVPELEWPYPVRSMWMQLQDGGRYALADGYVSYGPDSLWDGFWSTAILRNLRAVQDGVLPPLSDDEARASLSPAKLGAIVVFHFPRDSGTVNYLERVLSIPGDRQLSCTVFKLQAAPANTPDPTKAFY